jgi:MFS family permease
LQPVWSDLSDVFHTRRLLLVIGCLGVSASLVGVGLAASFISNFFFFMWFSIFITPIGPIGTAFVLDYLDEIEKPDTLSLIRVWGTIGFGTSSLLLGSLLMDKYLNTFPWILAGIYLLLALVSLVLPESKTMTLQPNINLKELSQLSKNKEFMFFLLGMIFIGATMIIASSYQAIYLLSMNASTLLIGIAIALPAFVEIPMMLAAPRLLRNVHIRWLIMLGALILPIRWILFYFIQNPGWVIPVQIFNGFTTIGVEIAGVSYIDKRVSPKWRATGQGLYTTATFGIGPGIGNFIAGNIIERYNIRAIWSLNLFLGMVGLILLFLALWFFSRPAEKFSYETNKVTD